MKTVSASLLHKELHKRQHKGLPNFFNGKFKTQEEFIMHEARFKCMLATRRFGKSYTGGLYLIKEAYENPGVSLLYIALTRDSAKKIMWKDVLKPLNRRFKLQMKFNETLLTATLGNGSIIYLMGVDSNEQEKDKLLGQKYKLAIIDECASYSIDQRELVYGILKPAMADLNGTIVMLGTPGNLTKSLFFDVTTGKEPGWHVIKGDTSANPYMADKWRKEMAELVQNQPYITETPMYKQMYLGEWVIDTDALVYKYNEAKNSFTHLPTFMHGTWQYLLGVDLGYEDPSGFVVVAFHEYDKVLYIQSTYKQKHMDITDVANKIKELKLKYNIQKVVVDGANKQAVEEIQKRHQIPLIAADKTGKEDFIEIMNAELIQAKIKLNPECSELREEWLNLVWKEKSNKKVENPSCENHLSDAALYIWRYTYQYLSEMPTKKPEYKTKEWYDSQVSEMEEAAEAFFAAQEEATNEDWD